jgi:hypothetical protein
MQELYLHPDQVKDMIKRAEREGEVIVIRCVRKSSASKVGGPDAGDLYDLHCGKKPPNYKPAPAVKGVKRDRKKEDRKNKVLTVFATNRNDDETGMPGAWRRVNLDQVKKVIYKTQEIEVRVTGTISETKAISRIRQNRIDRYWKEYKRRGIKRVYPRKGSVAFNNGEYGIIIGEATPYFGEAGKSERVRVLWRDGKITLCTLKGMEPYRRHERIL